jgi:hypothetical protein
MINDRNVLIICDRGAFDPSAYMDKESWNNLQNDLGVDAFDLRDNRYNQVKLIKRIKLNGFNLFLDCSHGYGSRRGIPILHLRE